MTELFYNLYDQCLECGMLPSEFWNCSHYDIVAYLIAKNKAKKEQIEEQTMILYNISLSTASAINGKVISYNKLFPTFARQEPKQQNWQKQKEIVRKFAERYNAKKKAEKGGQK